MNFKQWLGFLSFVICLYILWNIRSLLLLIFTAIVLAIALNRIVRQFQKLGIARIWAIWFTLVSSVLVLGLFFWLIVPPFIEQFQKLIELLPLGWDKLRSQIVILKHQHFEWLPPPPTGANLTTQLQPLGTLLFKNFVTFFSNTVSVIVQILLVFVLTLMMLVSPQKYIEGILKLFPSFYRKKAKIILGQCEDALGSWLSGTVINCLFIGILSGVGLYFLKVDLVLAHGLLAGVLNFIPNIGPTTSVIFPIMVALVDAPWKVVGILIWYFIIQNIESYLLTPTVMAKQLSLLPAVTLLAQIFFTQTFGVLGLLLALPLTVFTKIWIEEFLFKEILDQWK